MDEKIKAIFPHLAKENLPALEFSVDPNGQDLHKAAPLRVGCFLPNQFLVVCLRSQRWSGARRP